MSGMAGMPHTSTSTNGRACEDMSTMRGMSVMGESMAAMADHMCMTPLRPRRPGDEEQAKAVVTQVKTAIERYKDYRVALADGFVIVNPKLEQPQYHFNNAANINAAESRIYQTNPSSLI